MRISLYRNIISQYSIVMHPHRKYQWYWGFTLSWRAFSTLINNFGRPFCPLYFQLFLINWKFILTKGHFVHSFRPLLHQFQRILLLLLSIILIFAATTRCLTHLPSRSEIRILPIYLFKFFSTISDLIIFSYNSWYSEVKCNRLIIRLK